MTTGSRVLSAVEHHNGTHRRLGTEEAPLRIAIYDYMPYGYSDDNETGINGVFASFLKILKDESGLAIEPVLLPIARAIQSGEDGTVDLLISYRDPIMAAGVDFVADFACAHESFVSLPGNKIVSIGDLKNRSIAFPNGGYYAKNFGDGTHKQGIKANDSITLLRLLLNKRVDVITISDWVLDAAPHRPMATKLEDPTLVVSLKAAARTSFKEFFVSLSVSEKGAALPHKETLAAAVRSMREQGVIKNILAKHHIYYRPCEAQPQ